MHIKNGNILLKMSWRGNNLTTGKLFNLKLLLPACVCKIIDEFEFGFIWLGISGSRHQSPLNDWPLNVIPGTILFSKVFDKESCSYNFQFMSVEERQLSKVF